MSGKCEKYTSMTGTCYVEERFGEGKGGVDDNMDGYQ